MAMADDNLPSYEVVLVIEATANLVSHWDVIKKQYLIPAIQHFHEQSIPSGDFFSCADGNRYGLVLFHAADKTPESVTECIMPTREVQTFLKLLDSIEFMGGGGEHYSYVAEGLATTLQLFQDMELSQRGAIPEKICFLVSNSPPYHQSSVESLNHFGLNAFELAEKLRDSNVKLSVISPRHIAELQKLYSSATGTLSNFMNYGQDRRHLVLISGFQLRTEKEPIPLSESLSEDKSSQNSILNETVTPMEVTPSVTEVAPITSVPSETFPSGFSKPGAPFHSQKKQLSFNTGNAIGTNAQNLPQNSAASSSSNPLMTPSTVATVTVSAPFNPTVQNESPALNVPSSTRQTQGALSRPNVVQPPSSVPLSSTSLTPSAHIPQPSIAGGISAQHQPFTAAKVEAEKVIIMAKNQKSIPDFKSVWTGHLEWAEKRRGQNPMPKITQCVNCQICQAQPSSNAEVNAVNWPSKLTMQLLPSVLVSHPSVQVYFRSMRNVVLKFSPQDSQQLTSVLSSKNVRGLVHFSLPSSPETKILIVVFLKKKEDNTFTFIGLLPNDPTGFMSAIRNVVASMNKRNNPDASQQHENNPQASMQPMLQSNISNSNTAMQPNSSSMVMSDVNMQQQQYHSQQQQQQQQFQNRSFSNSEIGMAVSQNRINPNMNNMSKMVSVPMSSHMTMQSQSGNMMRSQMPDGGKVVSGMRNSNTVGNNLQMSGNMSSGQVGMNSNQGGIQAGQRAMPGAANVALNNNRGVMRIPQSMRTINIQGNRQEPTQLRNLLGSNNSSMQTGTIPIRQQGNTSLRPTVPNNNMSQQNFIRGSNIVPGMQSQRRF